MSHGAYVWVFRHICEWVMAHMYECVSWGTCMRLNAHEAKGICVCLWAHTWVSHGAHVWVSHGAHVSVCHVAFIWDWMHTRCRVYVCVFGHICEWVVGHMYAWVVGHMYECVMERVYEWVMGTYMRLNIYVNESRGICMSESWGTYMSLNSYKWVTNCIHK